MKRLWLLLLMALPAHGQVTMDNVTVNNVDVSAGTGAAVDTRVTQAADTRTTVGGDTRITQ